jgi:anaerobic selenocysteine-containing dehydrogenase
VYLTPTVLGKSPFCYQPVKKEAYPLALISPSNNKMISSILGEFNYPELRLTIHPDDAAARSIQDSETVRIFNELGEVLCRVQVSTRIRTGSSPCLRAHGASLHATASVDRTMPPISTRWAADAFNDARVEVK